MAQRDVVVTLAYDDDTGAYSDADHPGAFDYYWTFWCGEGGEEIDVVARSERAARDVCAAAIARDYEPIEIRHVERRWRGLTYL